MSIEVLVPVLPESVADATLITWHKKVRDHVNNVHIEQQKAVVHAALYGNFLRKII